MENNFEPKILKNKTKYFCKFEVYYKGINHKSNRESWNTEAK